MTHQIYRVFAPPEANLRKVYRDIKNIAAELGDPQRAMPVPLKNSGHADSFIVDVCPYNEPTSEQEFNSDRRDIEKYISETLDIEKHNEILVPAKMGRVVEAFPAVIEPWQMNRFARYMKDLGYGGSINRGMFPFAGDMQDSAEGKMWLLLGCSDDAGTKLTEAMQRYCEDRFSISTENPDNFKF